MYGGEAKQNIRKVASKPELADPTKILTKRCVMAAANNNSRVKIMGTKITSKMMKLATALKSAPVKIPLTTAEISI